MSKKDKLKKSIEDEIRLYDNFFKAQKESTALVSPVQERKKEAKAKLLFVNSIPDEDFDEFGNHLFNLQERDTQKAESIFGGVKRFTDEEKRYMASGTTNTSTYVSLVYTLEEYKSEGVEFDWLKPVEAEFTVLAEEKARKESLPKRLNKLHNQLGDIFVIACQSVEKARAGVLGIDQASMHLRDVVSQLWGNVVALAVIVNKQRKYKLDGLQLKKTKDREVVVDILGGDDEVKRQIIAQLLENLYYLHFDLSKSDFGKNILTKDIERLNSLYTKWIFLIDDIAAFINLHVMELD